MRIDLSYKTAKSKSHDKEKNKTVEAYQGTMQCEIVGEEYRVSVMLPGKEDS